MSTIKKAFAFVIIAVGFISVFLSVMSSSTKVLHQHATGMNILRCSNHDRFGYVLANDYSDQVTGAMPNIVCLQCWATTVSHQLRVVEPFLHEGSKLGFDLTTTDENSVKLSDILDINDMERLAREKGFSPLISWNHFLEHAPQDLILVCMCTFSRRVPCADQNKTFYQEAITFADNNGFQIVRYVYKANNTNTAMEFREIVYGTHNPSRSVVLFNSWSGIIHSALPQKYRIGISDTKNCTRSNFVRNSWVNSSKQIKKDARNYRERYMLNSDRYISVMFRSEFFVIRNRLKKMNSTKQMSLLKQCVNSISDYVHRMKMLHGIESVFLTMDCRKQGSAGYREPLLSLRKSVKYTKQSVDTVAPLLYKRLYGNSSSLEDWDDSFDKIGSYKAPGYIAQIQKYLASNGTCLLTAGGGSFQESAKILYEKIHTDTEVDCILDIPKC